MNVAMVMKVTKRDSLGKDYVITNISKIEIDNNANTIKADSIDGVHYVICLDDVASVIYDLAFNYWIISISNDQAYEAFAEDSYAIFKEHLCKLEEEFVDSLKEE